MPGTGEVFWREVALEQKKEGALPLSRFIGGSGHALNYHLRPLRTFMVVSSLSWSARTGWWVGRRVLAPLPAGAEALEENGDHGDGQCGAVQACLHAW